MNRTRLPIALGLVFALAAAPLLAQTEQPATAKPAGATGSGVQTKTPAQQSSTAPAKKGAATGAGANTKKSSDAGGNSPFDYRASEEISEDLPVSFPADI